MSVKVFDLYTVLGESLGEKVWQEYPRPQMKRDSFLCLNGKWDFSAKKGKSFPQEYSESILVPFCPESLLSGIHTHYGEDTFLFYQKNITLPEGFLKGRLILHFGAVDQQVEVFVNGRIVGKHIGGYNAFSLDITDDCAQEMTLTLRIKDDLRDKTQPYGKQTLKRGGMWYTPVSGVWQSVWLECVPEKHIEDIKIDVTLEEATVTVLPALNGAAIFEGREYPIVNGKVVLRPANLENWTPENPKLYDFTLCCGEDRVDSYFALRTLETKEIDGIPRLCLNGKPYFFHGVLDQGYWPDGIYTPASEEAFEQDILEMKKLGFNTLRKHIKVEPEAFYYACDRLGMVVFQDMVNNSRYSFLKDTVLPTIGIQKKKDLYSHKNLASRKAFYECMDATVNQLKNHPCICYWTIFNEGWGQFCADAAYDRLKNMDESRFIDSTSGWFRGKATDVESLHIYFGSFKKLRAGDKPLVLSECGGYCYLVEDHIFCPSKSYGYRMCKDLDKFRSDLESLYRDKIHPAAKRGLCACILTQISDVEEEINGLLTYDRKVCKADLQAMRHLAAELKKAVEE